eukprot:TRINITY_DN7816_c0_g1_i1.p1 TRINITY_DN7816_c0_g1~~TRINITY_DN7816_c0_g1_i1.p1  ORF type:complete len:609 (+),score=92.10 TRINITY_DN7816_c0_g1_i1:54-1880(+)
MASPSPPDCAVAARASPAQHEPEVLVHFGDGGIVAVDPRTGAEVVEAMDDSGPPAPTKQERTQWGSSFDYIVVLLGYAIGIGNVWRFPYLVGKYGGGAFLIPYLTCLVIVAMPLFLLELLLGQYTQCSTVDCFRCFHPMWVGVAYATTLMVLFVCTYYNMLLVYCVFYVVHSFESPLPWSREAYAEHSPDYQNMSSEHYWQNVVLHRLPKEELHTSNDTGGIEWHLVCGLLFIWLLVFAALFKGIHSSSKAAYITVPLPILLMVIMFFRAITLPGAFKGLHYYTRFDMDKMWDPEVWAMGCGQIMFSLSAGMGTAITMSSFTPKTEDVVRVTYIIAGSNSCFSLLAGVVVFSLLGNMAHESGRSVEDLADSSGAGLAFVALADGLSKFDSGANVFSLLFFLMLLTLGLDSTFAWVETLNTIFYDAISSIFDAEDSPDGETQRVNGKESCTGALSAWMVRHNLRPTQKHIAGCTAIVLFFASLPYCTRVGVYLLDVVDHFCPTYILLIVCFLQLVMVSRHMGYMPLKQHVLDNCNRVLPPYFPKCWTYVAPCMCVLLLIFILVSDCRTRYGDYPDRFIAYGVISAILPICCMVVPLLWHCCCPGGHRRY